MPDISELFESSFDDMFMQCEQRGLVLPWIVVSVSTNGSLLAVRVIGDGAKTETLAQHLVNDAFTLPINMLVVGANGEAARAVIKGPDRVDYN